VAGYYEQQGKFRTVNGIGDVAHIFDQIIRLITDITNGGRS
jgi:adenylate kinase family enzyme